MSLSNFSNTSHSDRLPRGTKTDRIFRILLTQPDGVLSAYKIAKLADAHQYQVSLILHRLENEKIVEGTKVMNYERALRTWARIPIKYHSQKYMLADIVEALKSITTLPYALTTYKAESMVNHYLFPTRIELYILPSDFDSWHALLVKRGAMVGGGNVRLRWYDDEALYDSFVVHGLRLVSIPQLIVDLLREGGVAVQAAEMMLRRCDELLELNHSLRQSSAQGVK